MNILVDFHHDSLLKSLYMLFEDRLGHKLYRPAGMTWFEKGYWAINNQRDTAEQFLAEAVPSDGTPVLTSDGQRTITYEEFLNTDFDLIIASIPQHIEPFKKLAEMKNAKLIIQMGNEWPIDYWRGHNVLASVKPRPVPGDCNAIYYHQEFDLAKFKPVDNSPNKNIYSFINILSSFKRGWSDFLILESLMPDFNFKSYGGQCRDGNMDGENELANKIAESQFVYHVKDNGDGYGHIIHNAYATGRPIITRSSDYKGKLGEDLLVEGSFIDLDNRNINDVAKQIKEITEDPDKLVTISEKAFNRFNDVVNFETEAEEIKQWLKNLK